MRLLSLSRNNAGTFAVYLAILTIETTRIRSQALARNITRRETSLTTSSHRDDHIARESDHRQKTRRARANEASTKPRCSRGQRFGARRLLRAQRRRAVPDVRQRFAPERAILAMSERSARILSVRFRRPVTREELERVRDEARAASAAARCGFISVVEPPVYHRHPGLRTLIASLLRALGSHLFAFARVSP
jgi:hypothetical protein